MEHKTNFKVKLISNKISLHFIVKINLKKHKFHIKTNKNNKIICILDNYLKFLNLLEN